MEVFALKFNFGKRKQGYISGKIEIKDEYPGCGWHTLFSTLTHNDFLLINTGKFTQLSLSGNKGLPISAMTSVKMKLDLVDKSSGILDFGWKFGFRGVEIIEGGEEEEEEEEKEEKRKEDDDDDIKMSDTECMQCGLWNNWGFPNRFSRGYSEKLLCKKVTCPCFSLEVMYAVYEEAIAASVDVRFVKWITSDFTRSSKSNGMHVYGQVTARNTSLSHPDATTTLFAKEIGELFHVKRGDLIPFLKTYVVLPRKSSLILDINLTHVLPNSGDHKLPPSELFVKTTLQITNQNSKNCVVVKDSGPANLFVDVTWHRLIGNGMF
ncbi:uncharacterized protein LOC144548814 [Carex rostrata]